MHPFGEVTHLETSRTYMRPPLFGNGDNIKSPSRTCLEIYTKQTPSMKKKRRKKVKVGRECLACVVLKMNMGVVGDHQDSWASPDCLLEERLKQSQRKWMNSS